MWSSGSLGLGRSVAEHVASSIVGFVRAVVEAAPFRLRPAPTPFDFERVPQDVIDGSYRLAPLSARAVGGFNFCETRHDTFDLWVARTHKGDQTVAMDALMTETHSLVAAVAQAGVTHDFDLTDDAWGYQVRPVPGASYTVAQITLPISYAAHL